MNEDTLRSGQIQIERKVFQFALKENPRGRFLRITEDVGGRRDTIIIPAPGLEEFRNLVDEMVKASAEIPPKQ
ncbi:MAG: RNA-binding protein [Verrucomicrobiae bacterium]|nr:RNA-binding protein [Verrucomicrobiae bacterium]